MSTIFYGLHIERLVSDIQDGLHAAVELFYENYRDAMCLDKETHDSLEVIANIGCIDLDSIILDVEASIILETNRTFTTKENL